MIVVTLKDVGLGLNLGFRLRLVNFFIYEYFRRFKRFKSTSLNILHLKNRKTPNLSVEWTWTEKTCFELIYLDGNFHSADNLQVGKRWNFLRFFFAVNINCWVKKDLILRGMAPKTSLSHGHCLWLNKDVKFFIFRFDDALSKRAHIFEFWLRQGVTLSVCRV